MCISTWFLAKVSFGKTSLLTVLTSVPLTSVVYARKGDKASTKKMKLWKTTTPFNKNHFGRDDVTRTRDPYVPNVVRYQLRSIPPTYFFLLVCKGRLLFSSNKFLWNVFHQLQTKCYNSFEKKVLLLTFCAHSIKKSKIRQQHPLCK